MNMSRDIFEGFFPAGVFFSNDMFFSAGFFPWERWATISRTHALFARARACCPCTPIKVRSTTTDLQG